MTITDLRGRQVMVVEDEYYLASDVGRLMRTAGAEVLGPFPGVAEAMAAMAGERPACAVLDIHLGRGASFELADHLRAQGVPFLFFTGYDRDAIPARFADVPRLEKPVVDERMVDAVARLLTR